MNQTALIVWGISTAITLLVGFLVRRQNSKPALQLSDFVILSFAMGGLLSGGQIIYQAFTDSVCQNSLGQEGTIVLAIGGGALVWVSGNEIWKFIFPQ